MSVPRDLLRIYREARQEADDAYAADDTKRLAAALAECRQLRELIKEALR